MDSDCEEDDVVVAVIGLRLLKKHSEKEASKQRP